MDAPVAAAARKPAAAPPVAPKADRKRKMSYKETQELSQLPDRIDACEREREALYARLADPMLLRDGTAVAEAHARLAALDAEIDALTVRWEELETLSAT
jgi:ATP-binding cassette subfamily F protein uup